MYGAGMRFKAVTLGLVLAGTALGSAALNLGRARGAAWIGQSLELVVPVQIDSAQADGALCAEADVFHGDSRQDNSRIQVQVEATGQSDTFNVRILSSAPVDEPVVTVYLRAGCAQKSSRKFVLLADFPSEGMSVQNRQPPPAPVPLVAPSDSNTSTPVQSGVTSTTSTALVSNSSSTVAAPTPTPAGPETAKSTPKKTTSTVQKVEEKSSNTEKPVAAQTTQAKPAGTGKSRLRLDPVDTLSERIKSLETVSTAKDMQDDVAHDNQKMQQLQADLRSLLDQAVKNEASLAAMRERLEKAESNRVPLTIVYVLVVLLLLCIAALVYFVSKRPRLVGQETSHSAVSARRSEAAADGDQQALDGEGPNSQVKNIDVDMLDLDDSSFGEMMGDGSEEVSAADARYHNFNADSLVDLRQQADFLAKLGKVDEALAILEAGIKINPMESPLLYLDLLVIANEFSRKTEFRRFRAEFVDLFNVAVPEFALFRNEGRKLDAYPSLLEHINGQWDSPNVLDVIEACILRDPDASEADPFDLAAFRELVNMHAAALEQHGAKL